MSRCKKVAPMLAGSTVVIIIAVLTMIDANALATEAQSSSEPLKTQNANMTVVDPSISNQEQSSSSTYQPESPTVKITSPQKGQKVPTGELNVYGISSDTKNTDCEVSIILNDVKPYQPVSSSGSNETEGSIGDSGERDYSTWEYSLTPSYTLIKEGENKITSKILCQNDEGTPSPGSSNLKHYSVNVTGFEGNNSTNSNYTVTQSSLSAMNTSYTPSTNGTVFIIPVPEDLLSSALQANNPDNNEARDTDDGEDTTNNGPDQDDNGDSEKYGQGKGKAKGHGKNKG